MSKADIVTGFASVALAVIFTVTGVLPHGSNASMGADLLALNTFPGSELARGRNHKDATVQPTDVSRAPTVKEESSSSSAEAVVVMKTACEAATDINADIEAVLKKTLPVRPEFAKARAALKKIQKDAESAYCGHASPSVEPSAGIDNDCEQYVGNTLRRTQCEIMEKMGREYRGY